MSGFDFRLLWMVAAFFMIMGILTYALTVIAKLVAGPKRYRPASPKPYNPNSFFARLRGFIYSRWWLRVVLNKDTPPPGPRSLSEKLSEASEESWLGEVLEAAASFIDSTHLVVISVTMTAFGSLSAIYILSYPGGPTAILTDILIGVCRNGGSCDVRILIPALAMALIILTNLVITIFVVVWGHRKDETDNKQYEEHQVLAEGLEEIRAYLKTYLPDIDRHTQPRGAKYAQPKKVQLHEED